MSVFSEWVKARPVRVLYKKIRRLRKEMKDEATQEFVEFLLEGMKLIFELFDGYRENIEGNGEGVKDFEGRYLFDFKPGIPGQENKSNYAIFKDGEMKTGEGRIKEWNVRVTFRSADALREFLLSKDQDIVNSMLKNEVEVTGNLNYISRFGFLVRDLGRRLKFA